MARKFNGRSVDVTEPLVKDADLVDVLGHLGDHADQES